MTSLYQVSINRADGSATTLGEYEGKVLLVVNVASECGLTPQYTALEQVHEKYRDRGFSVVAFPCNDFGAQEPGTNAEIAAFCETKFGVQFPVLDKLGVAPGSRHPLYQALIAEQPAAQVKPGTDFKGDLEKYGITQAHAEDVLWNFEKFLVDRSGKAIARFSPDITPDDPLVIAAIEREVQR